MRLANTALIAGGLGFAVSALVGCGSSGGLLTAADANQLDSQLNLASTALSLGECARAAAAIASFRSAADGFGAVDGKLISDLDASAATIAALMQRECPTGTSTVTKPPGSGTRTRTTKTRTTTTQTTPTAPTTPVTTPTGTQTTTTNTTTTTTGTTPTSTTGGVRPGGGTGNTGSGNTGGGNTGGGNTGTGNTGGGNTGTGNTGGGNTGTGNTGGGNGGGNGSGGGGLSG